MWALQGSNLRFYACENFKNSLAPCFNLFRKILDTQNKNIFFNGRYFSDGD